MCKMGLIIVFIYWLINTIKYLLTSRCKVLLGTGNIRISNKKKGNKKQAPEILHTKALASSLKFNNIIIMHNLFIILL